MAIQFSYTDRFGSTHSEAYAKIENYKVADPSEITVGIYINAAASAGGNDPLQFCYYTLRDTTEINTVFQDSTLKVDGKSPLTEIYGWLKTINDTTPNLYSLEPHGINWTTETEDV